MTSSNCFLSAEGGSCLVTSYYGSDVAPCTELANLVALPSNFSAAPTAQHGDRVVLLGSGVERILQF